MKHVIESAVALASAFSLATILFSCSPPDTNSEEGSEPAATVQNYSGTTSESNKGALFSDIPSENLVSASELHDAMANGDVPIFDIRSNGTHARGLVPTSVNIPAGRTFDLRMSEIPKDSVVYLIADASDDRLAEAYFTLLANGYDSSLLKIVKDGFAAWAESGYEIDEKPVRSC